MKQLTKQFIFLGSALMALAVAIGAFGAHGLKSILDEDMLKIYNTGVQYQFYHALGLLFISFLAHINESKKVKLAGILMFISTLIFSGSLYILTISGIKMIGAITPIGGIGFIISWILVILSLKEINIKE